MPKPWKGTRYALGHMPRTELEWFIASRQRRGVTLSAIASELGVTQPTLRKWGYKRTPHPQPTCPKCGGRRSSASELCSSCRKIAASRVTDTQAFCSACNRWLPLDDFYKRRDPRYIRPVRAHCKACEIGAILDRTRIEPGKTKQRARLLVNQAIARGSLTRQPCEVCGAEKVDAHHEDYAQPLAVRWLCRQHHLQIHR